MPISKIGKKRINDFCKALKSRLKDKSSNFGKDYLRLLVDEIRIKGKEVCIKGYYSPLAGALIQKKVGPLPRVPTLLCAWLARLDNCKNLSDSFQYKSKSLKTKPSSKVKKKSPPGPHPLHIAKKFQNQIEAESVNKAELARRNGMSRARVTQIMNLLSLEPRIKEEILNMSQPEQQYFTERKLRKIAGISSSKRQLQAFDRLKSGIKNNSI